MTGVQTCALPIFGAEVAGDLKAGRNVVAILGRNDGGVAAVAFRLTAGKEVLAESGAAWKASLADPGKGWEAPAFDDAKWPAATVVNKMGAAPWGDVFGGARAAAKKGGKRTPTSSVAAAEELILRPGFKAELLHNVPKPEQGSWVSLAVSPEGDLVAGDQGGVLWRVSLKDPAKPVVTKIDTKFFGCHGLLFAHGARDRAECGGHGRRFGLCRRRVHELAVQRNAGGHAHRQRQSDCDGLVHRSPPSSLGWSRGRYHGAVSRRRTGTAVHASLRGAADERGRDYRPSFAPVGRATADRVVCAAFRPSRKSLSL